MKPTTIVSKLTPAQPSPQLPKLAVLNSAINQISTLHEKNGDLAKEGLLNAIKCGLLFTAAKDLAGHGNFETWWETAKFGFSRATRCKYMQLSEQFSAAANIEEAPVLKIESTGDKAAPVKFVFNDASLTEMVMAISAGRQLSDLYLDWHIVKSPAEPKSSDKANSSIKRQLTPLKLDAWVKQAEQVPTVFTTLNPEIQSDIVSRLQALLTKLQEMQSAVQN
jgi:hypothetical protein